MYIGFNYHPSKSGCQYWHEWDEDEVRTDLLKMSREGFNVVRFFLFWKDFEPHEGVYDYLVVERLHQFIKLADEANLYCIPSILTIWMNGQIFKLPWDNSTDVWGNIKLKTRAECFLEFIGKELREYKNILYFDIGDEIIYANEKAVLSLKSEEANIWLRDMITALKKGNPQSSVIMASDHLSVVGEHPFVLSNISNELDAVAIHGFPLWTKFNIESNNSWKSSLYVSFLVSIAKLYGKPLVDEFGLYGCSDDIRADYMLTSGLSSILHGATGIISWCWKDFETVKEPFNLRPGERFVGFYSSSGKPKKSVYSLKECVKISNKIRDGKLSEKKVGIFLPEEQFEENDKNLDFTQKSISQFYAFLLLKKTQIPTEFCRENLEQYKAILFPSNLHLTNEDLENLKKYVYQGGILIYSTGNYLYGHGISDLFGIELEDYTLNNEDFRSFEYEGTSYYVEWENLKDNQIPIIKENQAEVLARFNESKKPIITINSYGKGKVYYINIPIESLLNKPYAMEKENFYKIYKNILYAEGIDAPAQFSSPFVDVHILNYHNHNNCVLINHSPREQNGKLFINNTYIDIKMQPKSVKEIKVFKDKENGDESSSVKRT
ncbi:beta-galactosidase trimerization domain-containing protein [Bacillus sp. FSL E2-8868]|uniref:beta-galactosidase trimerization domain-containing protein n=1 Tax=Bacillus sp. FSL E2-8868 TaxID=2954598 RepID=UPI0030F5E50A